MPTDLDIQSVSSPNGKCLVVATATVDSRISDPYEMDLQDGLSVANAAQDMAAQMGLSEEESADITSRLLKHKEKLYQKEESKTKAAFGDPIPLEPAPLPSVPPGLITGPIGEMIEAVTMALELPRELSICFALAMLSTATQGKFSVNPEPDYFEPVNLYLAAAMTPGNRKTAAMKAFSRPAIQWQIDKGKELQPAIEKAKSEHQIISARLKVKRAHAAKAKLADMFEAEKREIGELEKTLPIIPTPPRLFAEDITSETMVTLMSQHNDRMTILSDEGGGIFDTMGGRYSNGVANIEIFLKAHSGSPATIDRGQRPAVFMPNPLATIGISPQPVVLEKLIANEVFRRRGLCARFLYFLPKSLLGFRDLVPRPVPEQVSEAYGKRIRELLDLTAQPDGGDGYKPRILKFSRDAYDVWKTFAREEEPTMRPGAEFEAMTDWAGKLSGLTARLAAVLHCAEHGENAITELEINELTMTRAVGLAKVGQKHALGVLTGMRCGNDLEVARSIWRGIQTNRSRYRELGKVSARECWLPVRGSYKRVADIEAGLRMLVDHNYLCEAHSAEYSKVGRPSRTFVINPAL